MQGSLLVVQGGEPMGVVNASLAAIVRETQLQPPTGYIYSALFGMQGLAQDDLLRLNGMPAEALTGARQPGRGPTVLCSGSNLNLALERALMLFAGNCLLQDASL